MTTKAAWIVAGAIVVAAFIYVYHSPYSQCVRAKVAVGQNEAQANHICSALQFRR